MELFDERLKELMEESKVDARTLAKALNLADASIIYKWQKSEKGLLLNTAILLADFFNCSIEYLIGRDENYKEFQAKLCPPFSEQLKKILADKKISQYRLVKDLNLSRGNLNSWFNNKSMPNLESVIRLADYLNVTIDELVGRD